MGLLFPLCKTLCFGLLPYFSKVSFAFSFLGEYPCAGVLSHFIHVRLCATLWAVACQGPLSMGFSRKEYWSGLPCPPPGDLPNPSLPHCRQVLYHLSRNVVCHNSAALLFWQNTFSTKFIKDLPSITKSLVKKCFVF